MTLVSVKTLYRDGSGFYGQKVELSGWIRTLRASNAFGFI